MYLIQNGAGKIFNGYKDGLSQWSYEQGRFFYTEEETIKEVINLSMKHLTISEIQFIKL